VNQDIELSRQVLRLRHWQHQVNETMKKGVIKHAVHMAFGHEAIAVALSAVMRDDDRLVLTHRNIAYNLARAGALGPVLDEYRQLPTGASGARLGTMNMANVPRGVVYTSSILGNDMPVACGLALAKSMLGQPGIVIVLTGDGAMEEGTFYESLVFTRSQGLRCLFLIENNKYAMASTINDRRCPIAIDRMCEAVKTPYLMLSGNWTPDYVQKLEAVREAMVNGGGAACVEVDLSNLNRHAGPTPGWPTDPMNIDANRGLIVQESVYDPVFVLKHKLPAATFAELERGVLAEKVE
jgi:TPP-dependent pyruvate/acetoin dehydrogenase alpha subunit